MLIKTCQNSSTVASHVSNIYNYDITITQNMIRNINTHSYLILLVWLVVNKPIERTYTEVLEQSKNSLVLLVLIPTKIKLD